jgi:predicted TIM-barrel fold metal-dependent hydrolase
MGDVTMDSEAEPLIVFSGDSHIGPLASQLRDYCPIRLHDQFDEQMDRDREMLKGNQFVPPDPRRDRPLQTVGHHDMAVRVKEMDRDGVAAEIMFHGSQNNEPFPFQGMPDFNFQPSGADLELAAIGAHIYNQWLADACSFAPERLLGCMSLPIWDVDAAITEMTEARKAGLRMVNFPAGKAGILGYEHPEWEPFWAASADLDVVLCTHSGSADINPLAPGPHAFPIGIIEAGGWPSRRNMTRLIFSGVFERYPTLRLMLTEQNGEWWSHQVAEYDSIWHLAGSTLSETVPRPPHEYMQQSVFIGASFISDFEAQTAVKEGYWENVIWGRDYPHFEGTWVYRGGNETETATHEHLRWAFCHLPNEPTRAMLGDNAIRALRLDRDALGTIAAGISAPTLHSLSKPLDAMPNDRGPLAFREYGPWG